MLGVIVSLCSLGDFSTIIEQQVEHTDPDSRRDDDPRRASSLHRAPRNRLWRDIKMFVRISDTWISRCRTRRPRDIPRSRRRVDACQGRHLALSISDGLKFPPPDNDPRLESRHVRSREIYAFYRRLAGSRAHCFPRVEVGVARVL